MYVVMDEDGNLWGPFEGGELAFDWAEGKWPGQTIDDRQPPHRDGWSIVAIRPTD
jgi:hypothetical protein